MAGIRCRDKSGLSNASVQIEPSPVGCVARDAPHHGTEMVAGGAERELVPPRARLRHSLR